MQGADEKERAILALGSKLESLKGNAGWEEIRNVLGEYVVDAIDELDAYLTKESYPAWQDVMLLSLKWHERKHILQEMDEFIAGAINDKNKLVEEMNEYSTDSV